MIKTTHSTFYILIFGILLTKQIHAQISFSEQIVITQETDKPKCVHAADLDGDDDMDVLSASQDDDKIAWYENMGNGVFGSQQIKWIS